MPTDEGWLDEAACIAALREQYSGSEYAFLEQVGNSTGAYRNRSVDAIALGLWPSRGLLLHGFEVKVSRSDWKRELKNPAKADEVFKFCDRWWLVTPKGIVQPGELPPTWGHYEVNGKKKCRAVVQAPELKAKPLTKAFIAALMRRFTQGFDDVLRRATVAAREEGAANGAGEVGGRLIRAEKRVEALQERLATFEQKSGIQIEHWDSGDIATAVRALMNSAYRDDASQLLKNQLRVYERLMENMKEAIAALDAVRLGQ